MSETRALREKLEETQAELRRAREHLEKLRAHQARERESLQQELEAARREVAGLRGQLQEAESGGSASLPPAAVVLPEPVVGARSEEATTALVALARNPMPLEAALPRLSALLKLSPVDVRFRLAPMPPMVLARLPIAQAGELREALRSEGFHAVSCPVAPRAAGQVSVKRFVLDEQSVGVEGTLGENQRVRYPDLRLLMRGRQIATQVEQKHEVEIHRHAGGKSHRVHRSFEEKRDQVENFLWVLGKGVRWSFTQSTQFTGLGELRVSTVFENLQRLMGELQRRASHVVVDERFVQMSRFAMPLVEPARSQELLAEVLFQAVEEGLWA